MGFKKRAIGFGGAAILAAAWSGGAGAEEITISDDRTEPVRTSTVDDGNSGDMLINEEGSVTVDEGAAVTLDSDNSVTTEGSIATADANDTTGILVEAGHSGAVANSGTISLTEDYTIEDGDEDGDYDGAYALGANRFGILLSGAGAFTGDIVNEGSISLEGADSAGIRLDAPLVGSLSSTGSISVVGDRSRGIAINASVSGDVTTGAISVTGEDVVGVDVAAPIDGRLALSGSVAANGFHSVTHSTDEDVLNALDADDLLIAGPAVRVQASVAGGVMIAGIGVEDDDDDDGDGVVEDADGDGTVDEEDDSDDDRTGSLTVYGPSPALFISPAATPGAHVVLGPARDGFGLVNRGAIGAYGVYNGYAATGVLIEGEVDIAGGVLNDNSISATAYEARATALAFGAGASTPTLRNRGTLSSTSVSESAQTAYAVRVDAGSNASAFENSGSVVANLYGETGDAVAFSDASGNVNSILNTGSMSAYVIATDEDTDDGVTPVAEGRAVAFDLTANTTGVLLQQSSDVGFTDDDTTDDDADSRPDVRIIGDILFGSGADRLEILQGYTIGDISFGAGADTLTIDGGAEVYAGLSDSDGALTLDVRNGILGVSGGTVNLTQAHFGSASTLTMTLSAQPADSTLLIASGVVSFDAGALIVPLVPDGLPEDGAIVFLQSGSLIGAENVTGRIVSEGVPWLYNVDVQTSASDPNALEAAYAIKSADELGLNRNERAAFTPILAALRRDEDVADAFSTLDSEEEFFAAYDDLLPNFASGATELAATAIDQGQRAVSTRLSARAGRVDYDSFWLQEIAFGVTREAESYGVDYGGWGFGFAAGFDGPLRNGMLFGLSTAFTTIEVEEDQDPDNVIAAHFGQLNTYLGHPWDPSISILSVAEAWAA